MYNDKGMHESIGKHIKRVSILKSSSFYMHLVLLIVYFMHHLIVV